MSKEDVKYEVYKSKILEAAKKCPQGKEILKAMFPEAFEEKFYRCGTIFVEKSFIEDPTRPAPLIQAESLNHFWLLAHLGESRTYGLINMRSGFFVKNKGFRWESYRFVRQYKDAGVKISDEVLERIGLTIFLLPPEKQNKVALTFDEVSEG